MTRKAWIVVLLLPVFMTGCQSQAEHSMSEPTAQEAQVTLSNGVQVQFGAKDHRFVLAEDVPVEEAPAKEPPVEVKKDKPSPPPNRGGQALKELKVLATAYTHTGQPTATGPWPRAGRTVAVDPAVIPLGSRLQVEGINGLLIAEDTGWDKKKNIGLIRGRRIDIFMDSREEADRFGKREVLVWIIREGR
ncbi:3D domain-containing protein [Heliobacterium chlorum]|uniref:3D domain-containing protein n=1 Tax=Heliobacterium chlorum TaxID=2698 RepID=A0ABR7T0N9_HELCL|nr:3D domain-containing protein [Heliobacterium chlorum]MBC9783490.1 3D domain-containing protein [Heliobacterium chlorum]